MSEEIWKPVKGYEGLYEVSNMGRVKRMPTLNIIKSKNQYTNFEYKKQTKEKILVPLMKKGYCGVTLSKNGEKISKPIHRLVANSFIPNPDNLPQVNHKDENKLNNCVDNLEWCTAKYNCNYGTRNSKITGRPKNE